MNKIAIVSILISLCSLPAIHAQYAPQYPVEGNEAIFKTDTRIKAWASGVAVTRGWMDIADTAMGKASAGVPDNAIGVSNSMIVSLGDGGVATLTFERPIRNGEGPDFAVFENAFPNPEDDTMAFLELAFVEVSSDGERYVRFPAICDFQTDSQLTNIMYMDAAQVHNLAGKYIAGGGTPFDLEELKDSVGLDVEHVRYVRLIDVVGTLDPNHATYDARGMIINGPYPTAFPSCGFDLESVAVLNESSTASIAQLPTFSWHLFPNPATHFINISLSENKKSFPYSIYDVTGRKWKSGMVGKDMQINIEALPAGYYWLELGATTRSFLKGGFNS